MPEPLSPEHRRHRLESASAHLKGVRNLVLVGVRTAEGLNDLSEPLIELLDEIDRRLRDRIEDLAQLIRAA